MRYKLLKTLMARPRENVGRILAVFQRKNVKPQSMATTKHKFQKLVFNPANQKLVDLLDQFQRLAFRNSYPCHH